MLGWREALLCVLLSQLWALTPGTAGKSCSGFGHLENGRMFFRYGGLYVTFTCNPGFRIHGYRTSSCVSGQWARDPPLCVASGCPDPGDILHGSAVVSKDRSLAFYSCDVGFSLFGSALLYCTGKNWNSTKPVCNVADIMSVLHLNQESLHGPVSAHKHHLNSHLNTITAHKDAFLKLALPHFTGDKQTSRKPIEKKPSKNLLLDKTQVLVPEQIQYIQNFPIGSSDLQKPVPVTSNANSFHKSLFLTTTPISIGTSSMATQQVKSIDQKITETPYRRNRKGNQPMLDADRSSVPSTANKSTTLAPNSNTLGTNDHPQSKTSITEDPEIFASPTESNPSVMVSKNESVSSIPYQKSTSPSPCRGLCEQTPDFQETSPTPNPSGHTSSSIQITQTVSDLSPADVYHVTDSADNRQVNENSRSDTKLWQDLPLFPTRKRLVCPYPPFPSHGTFYFRSIKNPRPLQYKHYIQYACYPGYTLTNGDVYSYCQHNGQWSGQTPLCLELTPCSLNNGGCSQICHVNELHRAQCICKPGFLLLEDQRTCRDLDECVEELHLCQQVCENTLGSFRCSCRPGFQLSPDGTSCSDVDECQLVGRALCEFGCINSPGSFQCLCPKGYQLDSTNRNCVDINECEETDVIQQKLLHICEWKCVNLPGTYRCICPHGYRLHSSGHQCEDINECELKNGSCSHLCINHKGGYKCACPETHKIFPYNSKNCQPVKTHA